jgi:hypothetical protein
MTKGALSVNGIKPRVIFFFSILSIIDILYNFLTRL